MSLDLIEAPLYLMRHGKYEHSGLSDEGKDEIALMAKFLSKNKISFTTVVASEKKSAQETAAIISPNTPMQVDEAFNPTSNPVTALKKITSFTSPLLIVSHLPLLESLTKQLESPGVIFSEGTIAAFTSNGLKWVIPPSLLLPSF